MVSFFIIIFEIFWLLLLLVEIGVWLSIKILFQSDIFFGLRFGLLKLLVVIFLGVILFRMEVKMMGSFGVFFVIMFVFWVMIRLVVLIFVFIFFLMIMFGLMVRVVFLCIIICLCKMQVFLDDQVVFFVILEMILMLVFLLKLL